MSSESPNISQDLDLFIEWGNRLAQDEGRQALGRIDGVVDFLMPLVINPDNFPSELPDIS